jgi:hypothetical protein
MMMMMMMSQIHRLLRNRKIRYCLHNIPPPVPVMRQMNPTSAIQTSFHKYGITIERQTRQSCVCYYDILTISIHVCNKQVFVGTSIVGW